jgi:hypothetical protein
MKDTPSHELGSITSFPPSASARRCDRTLTSTKPAVLSRQTRIYNGKRANPVAQQPLDTIFEHAVLVQQSNGLAQPPVATVLDKTAPVKARASSALSALSSTPTEHVCGEASQISAVHPPSFSRPALELNSPAKAKTVVHPPSSSPSALDTNSLTASNTSVHPSTTTTSSCATRSPLRPITASALSGFLSPLCAWRFQTFYAEFLPKPGNGKDRLASPSPAILLSPLQDALQTID